MAPALQYRTATQRPRVPAARAGGGHAGIADAPTPSEPDWVSTARRHAPLKFCPDHSMGAVTDRQAIGRTNPDRALSARFDGFAGARGSSTAGPHVSLRV